MECPALELAGHWVELGLSVEMEISGRAFTIWYYMGPGGLWWTNVWNSALPPQRLRPDTRPEHQDLFFRNSGVFCSLFSFFQVCFFFLLSCSEISRNEAIGRWMVSNSKPGVCQALASSCFPGSPGGRTRRWCWALSLLLPHTDWCTHVLSLPLLLEGQPVNTRPSPGACRAVVWTVCVVLTLSCLPQIGCFTLFWQPQMLPFQLWRDLYSPFWSPGSSASFQPVFCENCCIYRCIPNASVERDELHVHLLLRHLEHQYLE